jgi:hypothetical protein
LASHLPKSVWTDALRHSFFAYNSFLCNTPLGFKTPVSILGKPPLDFRYLHPFGCLAYYKVPKASRKKLNLKSQASLLLSYLHNGNGYCLWDLENKSVIKSRDVVFNNNVLPYGSQLTYHPPPVAVELPWPLTHGNQPTHNPPTGSLEGPPSSPTIPSPSLMDLPLLDIPLQPCFSRCLSASIHAPVNAPPADISPPPAPPSTRVPTPLATPLLLVPLPPSPPVPISPTAPPPGNAKNVRMIIRTWSMLTQS